MKLSEPYPSLFLNATHVALRQGESALSPYAETCLKDARERLTKAHCGCHEI